MAEVRPWVGASISVGQFKTVRDLRVINFAGDSISPHIYFHEPPKEEWQAIVWEDIDRAFSAPVVVTDRTNDYVPTQILAEFFKLNGFDGIAYRSSLGVGYNLAFFDVDCAVMIACGLFSLQKVSFEFSECANPYFMRSDE
jgi:hypothetical protein